MTEEMPMVTLKNGNELPEPVVVEIMDSLRHLIIDHRYPTAFVELVRACRNRNHVLSGRTGEVLEKTYALIDSVNKDGTAYISTTVRSIVDVAVEGDGFDMRIVSPLAK